MATGCGEHGDCEQCDVEWDQMEVELMLAQAERDSNATELLRAVEAFNKAKAELAHARQVIAGLKQELRECDEQ